MKTETVCLLILLFLACVVGFAAQLEKHRTKNITQVKTCIETHPYPNKADVQIICGKLVSP
jgi:hypothetical protein